MRRRRGQTPEGFVTLETVEEGTVVRCGHGVGIVVESNGVDRVRLSMLDTQRRAYRNVSVTDLQPYVPIQETPAPCF